MAGLDVLFQVFLGCVLVTADLAKELANSKVRIHVAIEMTSLRKLLSTGLDRALIRPFLGMYTYVLNKLFEVRHNHTAADSDVCLVLALKDLE